MEEVKNTIAEALSGVTGFTRFVEDALKNTTIGIEMEFQYAHKGNRRFITSSDKTFNFELNCFQKSDSIVDVSKNDAAIKDFKLLDSIGLDGGGKEFRFKPVRAKEYIDNLDKFAKLFNYLQQQGFKNSTGDVAGTHVHLDRFKFGSLANIVHFIEFNARNADSLDRLWRRTGKQLSDMYTFRTVTLDEAKRFIFGCSSFSNLNGRAIRSCIRANPNGVGTFEFRNFNSSFDIRLLVARIVYLAASAHVYSLDNVVSDSSQSARLLNHILSAAHLLTSSSSDTLSYFNYGFLYESLIKLDSVKEVEETVLKPIVA